MLCAELAEFKAILSPGALLAVDIGSKKLGFAISDERRVLAMPLKTIFLTEKENISQHINNLIVTHKAVGIVLGLPIDMRGEETNTTNKVRELAAEIAINIPVFLQDERFSSRAADKILISLGLKRKQRNNIDDQVAASLILETVLDSLNRL